MYEEHLEIIMFIYVNNNILEKIQADHIIEKVANQSSVLGKLFYFKLLFMLYTFKKMYRLRGKKVHMHRLIYNIV